jgi:predicted fused transcriptional regulator/phosphomethylpyrimidine kinase
MAKDISMKKGDSMIKISEEFVDHYKKLGYEIFHHKRFKERKGVKNGNTSR